ncbi:hypothetical protein BAE44_0020933 [Dichanthelium oligosanthes]|uniref:Uncharacterized protein n=1 Tax=Dichanthelium oligosanthes TaxID=888268 RepID=A0A1E5UYZ3_9POAL|nr:hypothetical protein BAE44_0020933 [Dichanthelium oligosanthes]
MAAAAYLTVRDMLYFYCDARNVYERFIAIGSHPEQARNAVALLLWLDPAHHQAIRHLPSLNSGAIGLIAAEANSILECLRLQSLVLLPPIPFISALCQEGGIEVDAAFLAFNQDLVVRGVTDILDGVGALIFDDHLYRLLRRYQTGLVGRLPELEAPYTSRPVTVSEDCRSMIIFKSEAFVSLVLNGEPLVKITIGHRQIWLRKYIPRPHNL